MGRTVANPRPALPTDSIGERLRRARQARRLSAAELAEGLQRSEATVSGYENDQVEMSANMLIRAARVLGTTVAALVGEAPDPNVDLSTTPNLLAGVDVSDLDEAERIEIAGVVAYLAALRRQRHAWRNVRVTG